MSLLGWLTERRRAHLLEHPFPPAWDATLRADVVLVARLAPAEQARLRDLVQVFVAEKHWEGLGGLELDDRVRVVIAAQACLLLLGRDHGLFADVESILVYPSAVVAPARRPSHFDPGLRVAEQDQPVLGQAFAGGPVILAWDRVLAGAQGREPGHNVVVHEFAHKIDMHDGPVDGTPPLPDADDRRAWAEACGAAFLALRADLEAGRRPALDPYAATNEAEFFAVATEAYITRCAHLAEVLPAVHAVLADFYRFQPPT
ncbi:MAG: zinc-dependent peptidase [Kofleriaceae bacterium]